MQPSSSKSDLPHGLELHQFSRGSMTAGSETTLATDQQNNGRRPESNGTVSEKPLNQDQNSSTTTPEIEYPTGPALYTVFAGLFFSVLCVGLDRSIVATAIPQITSDFNSLDDVGWYGSAFLLTTCCFQLLFGKLYASYSIKWVYLISLVIFEVGSVVCAAAPNSIALILGRAVAGLGAAGLFSGALIMMARILPLEKRPKYTGAMGGAVGIAQIVAPTLGGVFTDKATWRWCFWINLPLGGITFFAILFFVHLPADSKPENRTTLKGFFEKFDIIGTLLLMPWVVCMLLALQWGGTKYPWNNWRIILLLVLFGGLLLIWVYVQIREGDKATVPPRIISNRSMFCGVWFMFCTFSNFFIIVYYIPIWFQTVRNASAYQSGINFLTTSAALSITVICAGLITGRIGYFVPCMIASTVISSIANGIIYTFDINTSDATWIGILILAGIGSGFGGQQPLMAAQTVFKGPDISLAISVLIFAQTLAGTVFISVAENVFQSELIKQLHKIVPDVDPKFVLGSGASHLREAMGKEYPTEVDGIFDAYNKALQQVFLIALILACLGAFGTAGMRWTSLKKGEPKEEQKKESPEQAELSRAPTA
ncbi:Fc.00g091680.m01.CDS01 [Cosmosporella sp. VM-42]